MTDSKKKQPNEIKQKQETKIQSIYAIGTNDHRQIKMPNGHKMLAAKKTLIHIYRSNVGEHLERIFNNERNARQCITTKASFSLFLCGKMHTLLFPPVTSFNFRNNRIDKFT